MYVITTAILNTDIRLRPATATSRIAFCLAIQAPQARSVGNESEEACPASSVVDHAVETARASRQIALTFPDSNAVSLIRADSLTANCRKAHMRRTLRRWRVTLVSKPPVALFLDSAASLSL
jgi:hypothetical protein